MEKPCFGILTKN